jgi:cell division protein FtsQ
MNPWHNIRLLHAGANALFALALIGTLVSAGWWVVHRPVFELRAVSIEPREGSELRYVSSPLLRQAAGRVSGSFFTVNLDTVRAAFESVPWVRRATARRVWPNRLQVTIEEHRAVAQWGDSRLINTYGELFAANLADVEDGPPLPELFGPQGSHATVIERWDELRRWLEPVGREPTLLRLTQRHAWTARLDDGTTLLLGRDQGLPIETRVRRWVGAHQRVQSRLAARAEVIDLRYPNGFAVRTAAVMEPESGKQGKQGKTVGQADNGNKAGAVPVGHRR